MAVLTGTNHDWKNNVVARTTANISLTYPSLPIIDGVQLVYGDRVMVAEQTNPVDNGIYFATSFSLNRAVDANTANSLLNGSTIRVIGGTTHAGTEWYIAPIPAGSFITANKIFLPSPFSGGGGGGTFTQDIVVSLSNGKTIGKYVNGQTIPAIGKTPEQVMRDIAIEDIAPVYTPAVINLADTLTNVNEVGTVYALNTLTATFTQNDAGALSAIRIQKNGSDITPNGTTSPFVKTDSGSYILGTITYQAFANYGAGIIKNYTPSGTPDARTPLVRNINAPQAAENNFASSTVTLTGYYNIFHGPSATAPINSANVRALPNNQLTNAGNVFILNTGTIEKIFTVALPPGKTLVSVIDLDALNANITANYVLTTFNVNDAGGNPVSYAVLTMTNAVPYGTNHQHQITIA